MHYQMTKDKQQPIQPILLNYTENQWLELIKKPLHERSHYHREDLYLRFGQIIAYFNGINGSEEDYFDQLYELANDKSLALQLITTGFDKHIAKGHLLKLYHILMYHQDHKLSASRLVSFLDREELLPPYQNPILRRHLSEKLIETLQVFERNHELGLADPSLRRVITDLIKWSWNQLNPWLKKTKMEIAMPKILYYGKTSQSEQYFLYYLMQIGCDLLIFQPSQHEVFQLLEKEMGKHSVFHRASKTIEGWPFPTHRSRKSTVAYKASEEIDQLLFQDQNLFKPWQLRDHIPYAVPLKVTYDELFLLLKEKAFIRPHFKVAKNKVEIPVVFAKITGIPSNQQDYWDILYEFIYDDHSLFIRQLPITTALKINNEFYNRSIDEHGQLDPKLLIKDHHWKYKKLPSGLQNGIAEAICRTTQHPLLMPIKSEAKEDMQRFIFSQLINLPNKILMLLQQFDYAKEVPRLIIFHNEENGSFSRADIAILLFLHQFGIDIILFNPTGLNDIEPYFSEEIFDKYWLDEMVHHLEFKEPSLLNRLFDSIKKA